MHKDKKLERLFFNILPVTGVCSNARQAREDAFTWAMLVSILLGMIAFLSGKWFIITLFSSLISVASFEGYKLCEGPKDADAVYLCILVSTMFAFLALIFVLFLTTTSSYFNLAFAFSSLKLTLIMLELAFVMNKGVIGLCIIISLIFTGCGIYAIRDDIDLYVEAAEPESAAKQNTVPVNSDTEK